MLRRPARAQVFLADFGETVGREQAGVRPALIVSSDAYHHLRSGLLVALPITSTLRQFPYRLRVQAPEGGLRIESEILTDQVRAISYDRLIEHWGAVSERTMAKVEHVLRLMMDLEED